MSLSRVVKILVMLLLTASAVHSQDSTGVSSIFSMSLDELMNLKVVTSAKLEQKITETSSKVVVITEAEIKEKGYTDLLDLLASQSEFQIQSQHGHWTKGGIVNFTGLRSGDSGNNKILILLDGVELNDAGGEGVFLGLNSIPLYSVKRVEIVYGPNSTIYGRDAFGGMINIITKSENNAYAGYSYGTYKTQKVYGGVTHQFSKDVSGSVNYYSYRSDEQDPTGIGLAYKYRSVFPRPPYTQEFYRASDNKYFGLSFLFHKFSVSYNRYDVDVSETYGSNPDLYVTEFSTRLGTINQVLSAKYENDFSPLANLNFEFTWKLNEFDPFTANLYTGDLDRGLVTGPADSTLRPDPLYAYGGRKYYYFRTESFEYKITNIADLSGNLRNVSGVELDEISGIPVISEGKGGKPITSDEQKSRLEHKLQNWGLFTEFILDAGSNIKLTFGGRIDQHSIYGRTFMPRAAIIFNGNNQHVRFTFSKGYIAPSVTQTFFESITTFSWIKTNENLKAEKNTSFQADYSCFGNNIVVSAGAFYNRLEDAIVESVTTGDSAFVTIGGQKHYVPILMSQNISSGSRYGINLSAEGKISDSFTANLNYTLVLGKDKILDREININKNLVSNHNLSFGMLYGYGSLHLYAELNWKSATAIRSNHTTGKYALLSDQADYLNFGPVLLANVNIRYENAFSGLSFYLRIRNLFDREYYGQTINAQWGSPMILQDLRRIDAGFDYEF